jgi:hypothetical protein
MNPAPNPDDIGEILVSGRSFAEYEAMFALRAADLDGSVLDCPGGASGFAAEASRRGAQVVAADPAYARPFDQLIPLVLSEPTRGTAHTVAGNALPMGLLRVAGRTHQDQDRVSPAIRDRPAVPPGAVRSGGPAGIAFRRPAVPPRAQFPFSVHLRGSLRSRLPPPSPTRVAPGCSRRDADFSTA